MALTILIVEDNEMNREFLFRRLRRRGFNVIVAANGQQGIQIAETDRPHLILMDMSVPVIDGWQAARVLKHNVKTNTIPIIALTAHAMAGDREKALAAGCDDYDIKPIEFPRLLRKIEALINENSA
jgi:CheY-like chemotaxis protein